MTAGTPQRVQMVQKIGLPVESRPTGAGPGAAGVIKASYSCMRGSRAALSRGMLSTARLYAWAGTAIPASMVSLSTGLSLSAPRR